MLPSPVPEDPPLSETGRGMLPARAGRLAPSRKRGAAQKAQEAAAGGVPQEQASSAGPSGCGAGAARSTTPPRGVCVGLPQIRLECLPARRTLPSAEPGRGCRIRAGGWPGTPEVPPWNGCPYSPLRKLRGPRCGVLLPCRAGSCFSACGSTSRASLPSCRAPAGTIPPARTTVARPWSAME